MTAAGPFTDRLPGEKNDKGKKTSPDWLLNAGSLYYSLHSNGHPELDYALIQPRSAVQIVDDVELFPLPCNKLLQLPRFTSEDFGKRKRRPVRLATASAGQVNGVLDSIPCFLEKSGASEPQKVYCVETSDLLAPGDVGAWVFDDYKWGDSRGSLFGHIVAWDAGIEVALLVPAYEVFADLATAFA